MDVHKENSLDYIIQHTEILLMPKHLLATFAVTDIDYHFIASIDAHHTRLRHGIIKAEKPSIIYPFVKEDILEGFEEEAKKLIDLIADKLGTDLRMLGYHFKNDLGRTSIQHKPHEAVAEQLCAELKEKPRTAIVKGVDRAWQIGLLKLIVEHARRSFPANVQELDERGFFPSLDGMPKRIRWRIEQLFREAEGKPQAMKELGQFLKAHNLFYEYEDRFFSLVKRHNP